MRLACTVGGLTSRRAASALPRCKLGAGWVRLEHCPVRLPRLPPPAAGPRTQAAAVLLFGWLLVGWLLPTLLLLQPGTDPPHHPARSRACGCVHCQAAAGSWLARLECALLSGLHSLLASGPWVEPGAERTGAQQQQQQWRQQWLRQHGGDSSLARLIQLGLRWACTCVLLWLPARALAPWYTGEP